MGNGDRQRCVKVRPITRICARQQFVPLAGAQDLPLLLILDLRQDIRPLLRDAGEDPRPEWLAVTELLTNYGEITALVIPTDGTLPGAD